MQARVRRIIGNTSVWRRECKLTQGHSAHSVHANAFRSAITAFAIDKRYHPVGCKRARTVALAGAAELPDETARGSEAIFHVGGQASAQGAGRSLITR